MSCRLAHDDGAYVLGALSPADRLAFEQHLDTCTECTRAVRELAGLPGLLGRIEAADLEDPAEDSVPPTLLPGLSREVRRRRRRRTVVLAGLAAAGLAALTLPVLVGQSADDEASTPTTAPTAAPAAPPMPMEPRGDVPVRARVTMEQVAWGTRLGLTCTYDTKSVEYELPPAVDYTLVVRTRDGQAEQVGSWRSLDGRTISLTAATSAAPEDIRSVQVRTAGGRVVLSLAS